MQILIDANILIRLAHSASAQHAHAVSSVQNLQKWNHRSVVAPQSIYEFWVVATRPIANNGLGLSIAECDQFVGMFLNVFPLLPEAAKQFENWRMLTVSNACHGKLAHDVRYVSSMISHGIHHLLTFNTSDFRRFKSIRVVDPIDAARDDFVIESA